MHAVIYDLFHPGIPIAEKVLRTLIVYAFLIVGLRLAGKRELSQLNPFDLVVLLLLANTVQNAIIGNDNSLAGGVVGATTLLVANWLLIRTLFHYKKLDTVEGSPDILVERGKPNDEALERALITHAELAAAARRQGIDRLEDVDTCRLETGGALTFVPRVPTAEERRQDELVTLLRGVSEAQERLVARLDAIETRLVPPRAAG
ncbi:MAG TPA: YetF domain-containing protein [Gemmatimonadaceae bacterium]|nr:YetF domain-containing protein [Gemmatimonadaceae bacterium]